MNENSHDLKLISLIGEQPVPALLVARALKACQNWLIYTDTTHRVAQNLAALLPGAILHPVEPYDLSKAVQDMESLVAQRPEIGSPVVNLTGGTKPMALAAYEIAREHGLPVAYLQSEGQATVLYWYNFSSGQLELAERRLLPGLIDLDDYLLAHGLQPIKEAGPANAQEAGMLPWLKEQVDECRSNLIFGSFEIDFLLRRGNRVAVLETKNMHITKRKGIDQLNTIAGRDYLGTYTGKILVTARPLPRQHVHLAKARRIIHVQINDTTDKITGCFTLDEASQQALQNALDKTLGPRG